MLTESMKLRAVAIADQAMRSVIECEGVPYDTDDESDFEEWGPTDEHAREVPTIEEASPAFRDAFAWLRDRGLAHSRRDGLLTVVVMSK